MDDDYYDAFAYYPDSRDSTRQGLGLKVGVRGFQWANPQAGNVIFWHYDITNESDTDYDNNIIFGLYMDSGVGGSARSSCDGGGGAESDDDNAFFDRSLGLNLVYTWDNHGTGVDLLGQCQPTGYLGYAYLETPDAGEGNGVPTEGEPDFDRADLNESDQIGLTGFKMNRIFSPGGQPTDGILFYTDDQNWPARLYTKFTDPNPAARFDSATV